MRVNGRGVLIGSTDERPGGGVRQDAARVCPVLGQGVKSSGKHRRLQGSARTIRTP